MCFEKIFYVIAVRHTLIRHITSHLLNPIFFEFIFTWLFFRKLLIQNNLKKKKNQVNWTQSQRERAEIIFEAYPDLRYACQLAQELTDIYNSRSPVEVARTKLARWHDAVEEMEYGPFQTVLNTFHNHYQTILNFFVNRDTNAFAESFNARLKAFRNQFRV